MPKGAIIRQELQTFISEELQKQGYHKVFTPHIGRLGSTKHQAIFPIIVNRSFRPLSNTISLQSFPKKVAHVLN